VDIKKAQNSDQILDTSSPVPGRSSIDNINSSKTTSEKQGLVHQLIKAMKRLQRLSTQ
jgi:hypothetical protein